MSIFNIQLYQNQESYPLPDWVQFAFGLGAFLSQEGVKYKRSAHIAVSLPSDKYFAVLVACGIADKTFSERKNIRSIRKQVLGLNSGSRVILSWAGTTKKVSVISIEKNPLTDEMLLYVQDGSLKHGIPERSWVDSIFLLDEEFDEIKRTRRVNKNIGINSPLINSLYTQAQLKKTSFYPGEEFYLVGNRSVIESTLKESAFISNGLVGSPSDFLYFDEFENNSSYINGKFISSQTRRFSESVNLNVPVLYSDYSSYRRQSGHFDKNPSLIIISRTDHEHRIYEAQTELSRIFIQENVQFITNEVVNFIDHHSITIPGGIEMIAWRMS